MATEKITIKGAREHNLKNVSLEIPKNELVVFTGVSGSGKSSLAFDTIFAEGQRRYMESLSSYARMFLGVMDKPDVDLIEGLSPAISIEQKSTNKNPRSTVGTITEIYDYYDFKLNNLCLGKIEKIKPSDLSDGYDDFIQTIQRYKPRLVIIDPRHAFLGANVDINRVNAVRPVFQRLANMAKVCRPTLPFSSSSGLPDQPWLSTTYRSPSGPKAMPMGKA